MRLVEVQKGVAIDLDAVQAIMEVGEQSDIIVGGQRIQSTMSYSSLKNLIEGKRGYRNVPFKDELLDIHRQMLAGQTTPRP